MQQAVQEEAGQGQRDVELQRAQHGPLRRQHLVLRVRARRQGTQRAHLEGTDRQSSVTKVVPVSLSSPSNRGRKIVTHGRPSPSPPFSVFVFVPAVRAHSVPTWRGAQTGRQYSVTKVVPVTRHSARHRDEDTGQIAPTPLPPPTPHPPSLGLRVYVPAVRAHSVPTWGTDRQAGSTVSLGWCPLRVTQHAWQSHPLPPSPLPLLTVTTDQRGGIARRSWRLSAGR